MANLDWGADIKGSVPVGSVGRFTFSVDEVKAQGLKRISDDEIGAFVRRSANGLVARLHTTAPAKTGALRRGIIPSPGAERSATPGKVVYDVYMDEAMNDTFVKYSRAGKRYYYPASQEYGFRLKKGGRYPGRYYMKTTSISYEAAHEQAVIEGTNQILEAL